MEIKSNPVEKAVFASRYSKEKEYWLKKLSGDITAAAFPVDLEVANGKSSDPNFMAFRLETETLKKLRKLCNKSDVRLHMVLVTALVILLEIYSRNQDIILGTPIYKQATDAELSNTVLVLRNRVESRMTFKEMLLQVKATILEAVEHQGYPFEVLAQDLNMVSENRDCPLVDVAILLENIQESSYLQHFKPGVIFNFVSGEDFLEGRLDYNQSKYKQTTVERVIHTFRQLLRAVLDNMDVPLSSLDILSAGEKRHLLYSANFGETGCLNEKKLHDLFEAQAKKGPARLALVCQDRQVTYRYLDKTAQLMSAVLRDEGLEVNGIAGLNVIPSVEMMAGILGILKAGGAYMPIDPLYPHERKKYMLEDAGVTILITGRDLRDRITFKGKTICLDERELYRRRAAVSGRSQPEAKLAYIIYTSGTTGSPKGCLIEHRNIVSLMLHGGARFDFHNRDVWTLFHSYCFDFSVWEMYGALLYGGKLTVLTEMVSRDPREYLKVLNREKVTVLSQTPTAFYHLANEELKSPERMLNLRYVIFGGETLMPHRLKGWREKYPQTRLINMFGITETTVHVTYKEIGKEEIDLNTANVGKPLPYLRGYTMDRDLRLLPLGAMGELCIGGEGVGRGYLNRVELTAQKFVKNPYIHGEILYRSGDLARLIEDGEMVYCGRLDHQVKIRGYRVELGEIENQLLAHQDIDQAVVLLRGGGEVQKGGDGNFLVAYMISSKELNMFEIRDYLSGILPGYMLPAYFLQLGRIPLTVNGKLNKAVLYESFENYLKDVAREALPTNEVEKKILEIWEEVLGVEGIGTGENFFNVGGDSIKAINLINLLETAFDIDLKVADLYLKNTIRELAGFVTHNRKIRSDEESRSIEPELEVFKKKILTEIKDRTNIEDLYPMSDVEKGMIFHSIKDPGSAVYHDQLVYQIKYPRFVFEDFKRALTLLIHKHPILRTAFNMEDFEQPVQIVYRDVLPDIEHFDISYMAPSAQAAYLQNLLEQDRQNPLDLAVPPLWRLRIFGLDQENICVVLVAHHAILDGWSVALFMTELNNTYLELKSNPGFVPLRLKADYREFVVEQIVEKQENASIDYWRSELMDYRRLDISTVFGENGLPETRTCTYNLKRNLLNRLKAAAESHNTTVKNLCFGAYVYMLNMFSFESDLVVGLVANNRPLCEDGEKILGCFLNTVPFRIKIPERLKWSDYLAVIDEKMQALKRHDRISLFEILRIIGEKTQEKNPVFDTLFNFIDFHVYRQLRQEDTEDNWQEDLSVYGQAITNMLMDFTIDTTFGGFRAVINYNSAVFGKKGMEIMMGYFTRILEIFIGEPGCLVDKASILPVEEKQRLLYEFNNLRSDDVSNKALHELFEEQVARTPGCIALIYKDQKMTYRKLNEEANRLARLSLCFRVEPGSIAGLMIERSPEMVTAVLAVMKAGGACLPLDPAYPERRILYYLQDSEASILFLKEKSLNRFSAFTLKADQSPGFSPIVTPPRKQIEDFDRLPLPDRTLVSYEKYHQHIGIAMVKHSVSLQATRGCPFNCAFCHKIWPKRHVSRGSDGILREILACYDAGIRRFVFIDDIFNLSRDNGACLFEEIIRRKLNIQLFFPNGLRGDILTREYIDRMMEAGTVNIDLALESASPRIQKLINKNLNLEQFKDIVEYIVKNYPRVLLEMELMIGFPTETEAEARMTLEFLKELRWIHFPNLNILKIYPNTAMYNLALEHGVSDERIKRSVQLAYHELPETLPFSKGFVQQYQAQFMGEYFLDKERLLCLLPNQLKILTADELVQKYDSYLPADIGKFSDILQLAGISADEFGEARFLPDDWMSVPEFNEEIRKYFPPRDESPDAFRVLLLDLSLLFSSQSQGMLYDMVEEPLGLMYLMSYLNDRFGTRIRGRVAKSRVDFDSFEELRVIIADLNPHVIGIRTLSYDKDFFHTAVFLIKQWQPDVPIVAGGPYATSDYREMLQDPDVDLAVLGEGEYSFGELIDKIMENGNKLPGKDILEKIHGIAFLNEDDRNRLRGACREIVPVDRAADRWRDLPTTNMGHTSTGRDLAYVIYTSGSTGRPKGVMLEHRNLVNLMAHHHRYTNIDCRSVLQFASLSFDASFHEIFSALLAGGELLLIPGELRGDILNLFKIVEQGDIKTLFLPMSFLNVVFGQEDYIHRFPSCARHIQTAGEQVVVTRRFRKFLKEQNVYLHNHYGPSETHVVTALTMNPEGPIPDLPPIGQPILNTGIYVLDKHKQLQPVGVAGELFVGGEQVGRGYWGREKLTNDRFISILPGVASSLLHGEERFYQTGDLARWLPDGSIEFLGRIDHQVKIRGFRVELGEIESLLLNHGEIKEAVVQLKTDEHKDKYLCAYLVADRELGAAEIRQYLSRELPDYMIPSYFVHLGQMPLTPNGKVDRRGLPDPKVKPEASYAAPADFIEERLAEIWSDVLGIEKELIGTDANFFELGGHSLKATVLIQKIHKAFQTRLPMAVVFKNPRIRGIAEYIRNTAESEYSSIEAVEKREVYPLSSAQKRLFAAHHVDEKSTGYNITSALVLKGDLKVDELATTFRRLINRHESFRTSFLVVGDEPVQKIAAPVDIEFPIEYYKLNRSGGHFDSSFHRDIVNRFVRPFDLKQPPLLRVGLADMAEREYVMTIDMHHIISDGVSAGVLIGEFTGLFDGRVLPPLRIQYKDYAVWQGGAQKEAALEVQQTYWLQQFERAIPVLKIPTDYPGPAAGKLAGDVVSFRLGKEKTKGLKKMALDQGTTLFVVLLTIFYILLHKIGSQEDIVVGTAAAGRNHEELQQVIGMFVNTLALRNFPVPGKSFIEFLGEVRQGTLEAFDNQDYPFEALLANKVKIRNSGEHPIFNVMFGLQNLEFPPLKLKGLTVTPYPLQRNISLYDLTLMGQEVAAGLGFSLQYSTALFKRETIKRFSGYFKRIVTSVLDNHHIKIRTIEILTDREKSKLVSKIRQDESFFDRLQRVDFIKSVDCVTGES